MFFIQLKKKKTRVAKKKKKFSIRQKRARARARVRPDLQHEYSFSIRGICCEATILKTFLVSKLFTTAGKALSRNQIIRRATLFTIY